MAECYRTLQSLCYCTKSTVVSIILCIVYYQSFVVILCYRIFKVGSKAESAIELAHFVASQIDLMEAYASDVIFDDRPTATIGKKLLDAKRVGYPFVIVAGKNSANPIPLLELHDLNSSHEKEMTVAQIFNYLKDHNCS